MIWSGLLPRPEPVQTGAGATRRLSRSSHRIVCGNQQGFSDFFGPATGKSGANAFALPNGARVAGEKSFPNAARTGQAIPREVTSLGLDQASRRSDPKAPPAYLAVEAQAHPKTPKRECSAPAPDTQPRVSPHAQP